MPRLRVAAALLALACVTAGLSAGVSGAQTASRSKTLPFTLRGARFSVLDHRLTYTVTICTSVKSVLAVRATFAPATPARGAVTLTPGTTQYQDHGCWPAFVSTALARTETKRCKPIDCPAILGHRYRSTVTITFAQSRRETRRAPRLQAVAR
jgi:hypothetical protein